MHITSATRGPFDDLLAVANTRHGPGGHYHARPAAGETEHDHLADPRDARRFLADHDVTVPDDDPAPRDLAALVELREIVRALAGDPLEGEAGTAAPGSTLSEATIGRLTADRAYRLDPHGRPVPVAHGWAGVIDALVPPILALTDVAGRLRVCANRACRFAFVDRSRNRSRRWCESAFCGNRIRVGRHRHHAAARSVRRGTVDIQAS